METISTAVQEKITETSLNWRVREEQLITSGGIIVPNKKAIIREDNNAILGIHGDGYVPYQNEELLELLHKITHQTGLKMHNSGYFGEGQKVWFQLESQELVLPYKKVDGNNDTVNGYVSGINSFDGSSSLGFGNSNVTVSCTNSFFAAYKGLEKVRHTQSMKIRIESVLKRINSVLEEEKKTFKEIIKLTDNPMTEVAKKLVKELLFEIKSTDRFEDLSTRKQNQIIRFDADLQNEVNEKGDSLWGLFSGVTKYTTHSIKADNSENKMFGKIGNVERKIYKELVGII